MTHVVLFLERLEIAEDRFQVYCFGLVKLFCSLLRAAYIEDL